MKKGDIIEHPEYGLGKVTWIPETGMDKWEYRLPRYEKYAKIEFECDFYIFIKPEILNNPKALTDFLDSPAVRMPFDKSGNTKDKKRDSVF